MLYYTIIAMLVRKDLQNQVNKLLKKQSNEQLQQLITIMESGGVKLYAPNGLSDCCANVPILVIQHQGSIGPTSGRIQTDEDRIIINDKPINFHHGYIRPDFTALVSEYVQKTAEKYVPHPDYMLADHETVLIQGDGQFVYKGLIFYSQYNGSVSYIYTTREDKALETNRYYIATRKLLRVVRKSELEQLKVDRRERYAMWARQAYMDSSDDDRP